MVAITESGTEATERDPAPSASTRPGPAAPHQRPLRPRRRHPPQPPLLSQAPGRVDQLIGRVVIPAMHGRLEAKPGRNHLDRMGAAYPAGGRLAARTDGVSLSPGIRGRPGFRGRWDDQGRGMIRAVGSLARSRFVAGGGGDAGGVVARPGLAGRLGGPARVTVVSAPAGSGKTVLLRSWIAGAGLAGRAAWVAAGHPRSLHSERSSFRQHAPPGWRS